VSVICFSILQYTHLDPIGPSSIMGFDLKVPPDVRSFDLAADPVITGGIHFVAFGKLRDSIFGPQISDRPIHLVQLVWLWVRSTPQPLFIQYVQPQRNFQSTTVGIPLDFRSRLMDRMHQQG